MDQIILGEGEFGSPILSLQLTLYLRTPYPGGGASLCTGLRGCAPGPGDGPALYAFSWEGPPCVCVSLLGRGCQLPWAGPGEDCSLEV